LPAVNVSYPAAQVEGQLSGGEIAHPIGASRPTAVIDGPEFIALNLSLNIFVQRQT
jgi:hypothetical protein